MDDDGDGAADFADQEIIDGILQDGRDDDGDGDPRDEPGDAFDDSPGTVGVDDDADVTALYPDLRTGHIYQQLNWEFRDNDGDGWWDIGEPRPCDEDLPGGGFDCDQGSGNIIWANGITTEGGFYHDYIDDYDGAVFDDDENGRSDDIIGAQRDPTPSNHHGTWVAGAAGAEGRPAPNPDPEGIAGVMWDCKIMSLYGGDNSSFAVSLHYAANMGAHVVNMSVGEYGSGSDYANVAIEHAYSANVVMVAAAANDQLEQLPFPANNELVMAVAATDSRDMKAIFSNYHQNVDVSAPGLYITTTQNDQIEPLLSYEDRISGTSLSSPIVAGVAGLIISEAQGISNEMVRDIIKQTADNIDDLPGNVGEEWEGKLGTGRINAGAALQLMVDPPAKPSGFHVTKYGTNPGHPKASWNANSEADLTGYHVYRKLPGQFWVNIAFVEAPTTFYIDYEIAWGNKFDQDVCYQVTAVDIMNNESILSSQDCAPFRGIQKTSVSQAEPPSEYGLEDNFPNPFNPMTTIKYQIPVHSHVNISIFNIWGQQIRTLVSEPQVPAFHSVIWDGRDSRGAEVSSGVYLYCIKAASLEDPSIYSMTKKMILLR